MMENKLIMKRSAQYVLSVLAFTAVLGAGLASGGSQGGFWIASAQADESGGDHQGGSGGSGGHEDGSHDDGEHEEGTGGYRWGQDGEEHGGTGGHHDGGHDDGGHDDGGHDDGGHDDGGHDEDSGKYRWGQDGESHGAGGSGTQPAWAREGIPEVELGRLNVVRSPEHVLDRALVEALATLSPDMVGFYSMSLDEVIEQLSLYWDETTFIDSPLQNLSLLKDALDGTSELTSRGVQNDLNTLMAVFLGTASDKALPISTNTVIAVTTILGQPVTGNEAAALAQAAEAVRIAILAGHG